MNGFAKSLLLLVVTLPNVHEIYAQGSSSKLIPYRIGLLWGYADRNANIVIPTRYQEVFPFLIM